MSRVTADSIERVRTSADMVEVVSAHTDLRRQGARWVGLCPFHDERTPSFSIDPVEKLYYCFGCQAGGNIFTFLEEKEGLDFRDAVEQLADRYGVELEYDTGGRDDERRRARERLIEVLSKTATFYSRYLWESSEAQRARAYLEGRGLGREILEEFGVGYAPSAWDRVLTSALRSGYSEAELQAAGLAQAGRRGPYDRFRGRIVFPLRDARGRVLGFGARAMRDNQQPKYVNSPEGPVYRKGRSLFGVDRARAHATKEGSVFVVEGYTDVLAMHQAGFRNTVASMGTALTDEQVGELARLAREVVLAFDADASGQEAMLRAQAAAAGRGLSLKVARLPDDKDPSDLLAEAGPDSFKTIAGDAIPILEFQVTSVLERAQMHSAADKDRLVAQLAPVFGSVAPSAERDELVRRVADRLDLREEVLKNLLQSSRPVLTPTARPPRATSPFERSERAFLAMCVSSGERGRESLGRLSDDHLSSDTLRQARDWLLEHFDAPTAGLATEDPDLARVVGEIVVRASSEPASEHALELAFLQLEQRRLEREIKAAAESSDFDRQRELSVERSRVIARLMGSGEPSPSPTDGRG